MQYKSTRGAPAVGLDEALVRGIAPDGGLYVPTELPQLSPEDFAGADNIAEIAQILLTPFFAGSSLAPALEDIIAETFHFPLPVSRLPVAAGYCGLLELFHGPTAAFKDVGAGFLAACLSRLEGDPTHPLTILVATSGDTGGAVAAAFNERPGMRVAVLYPDGRVSKRQAHQLTCWGSNVLSLAVSGSFDDCQSMVKQAMADKTLAARHRFSSANSINIGRLLPQAIYYASASLEHWRDTGHMPSFIVPTGNLGNALACFLARDIGLPIGKLILATNENRLIVDFLDGADWAPRASIATLASAMDVGNPSNMERLRAIGGEASALATRVRAIAVSDEQITAEIRRNFQEFGIATCPHTATATVAWRSLEPGERLDNDWILVATAHAAKFERIVEPIIGEAVPVPPELAAILSRERHFVVIDPTLAAFSKALDEGFPGESR